MSPLTHLVGSWLIARFTTHHPRDRIIVTLAGVLPAADGLGAVVDVVNSWVSGQECSFHYYQQYHHIWLRGWPGVLLISEIRESRDLT